MGVIRFVASPRAATTTDVDDDIFPLRCVLAFVDRIILHGTMSRSNVRRTPITCRTDLLSQIERGRGDARMVDFTATGLLVENIKYV